MMKRVLTIGLLAVALVVPSVVWLVPKAIATFTATAPRNEYVGNGATAVYAYTFRIFEAADLLVTRVDTAGVATTLALTTDYTVSGVGAASGGNVTLVAGNLTSGYTLVIRFHGATKQSVDLRNQGGVFPESIEDALDRLGRYVQKNEDKVNRSLHLPEQEVGTETKTLLPTATARASKFLGWDASGNPIAAAGTSANLTPVSGFINTLLDDADAATARTTLGAINGEPADNVFRVVGSSDATKKVALEVDGLTTATTRTVTVPDRSVTLGTVLMTPVVTTSGTTIDFTGIPAGVRVITFMMNSGVSTNGTTNMILQIGDSGGIESSGYVSYAFESGGVGASSTSGYGLTSSISAATLISGAVTLTLENASANTWVISGNLLEESSSLIAIAGRKTLSATLDRVRLTTTGSDTFDAGEVNVAYQF